MIFDKKRIFIAMICAVFIGGLSIAFTVTARDRGANTSGGARNPGGYKNPAKWPLENLKEWPPKNIETDNMDIGVNVKDGKIVFGPSWKKSSKEELGAEIDMENSKELFTVYYEEINNEDPAFKCIYKYKVCSGGMCVTRYLLPGCTP